MTLDDMMPMLAQTYVDSVTGTTFDVVTPSKSRKATSVTDDQLARLYRFESEIGHGSWAGVWKATERGADGSSVAIKLVHRTKTSTSNLRVKALWAEYK